MGKVVQRHRSLWIHRNYEIVNRSKWIKTVYEHIYTMHIQYMEKWNTSVETLDACSQNLDIMFQFSTCVPLHNAPVIAMPTR